jgi:hypothetical protein
MRDVALWRGCVLVAAVRHVLPWRLCGPMWQLRLQPRLALTVLPCTPAAAGCVRPVCPQVGRWRRVPRSTWAAALSASGAVTLWMRGAEGQEQAAGLESASWSAAAAAREASLTGALLLALPLLMVCDVRAQQGGLNMHGGVGLTLSVLCAVVWCCAVQAHQEPHLRPFLHVGGECQGLEGGAAAAARRQAAGCVNSCVRHHTSHTCAAASCPCCVANTTK